MESRPQRPLWPVAGLAVIFLAGCTLNPVSMAPRPIAPPPGQSGNAGMMPGTSMSSMPGSTAASAEQACIAAGRERGFDVQGVVGTSAGVPVDGVETRDVILRVQRNGTVLEPRCNFVPSTQSARIMLI